MERVGGRERGVREKEGGRYKGRERGKGEGREGLI